MTKALKKTLKTLAQKQVWLGWFNRKEEECFATYGPNLNLTADVPCHDDKDSNYDNECDDVDEILLYAKTTTKKTNKFY